MNVVICDAIRARRLLRFFYDGYERVVEPHVYGMNAAGREALSAWLVGGWSKSDPEPGWRMYLLGEMRDVAALAEGFEGARPGYNPEDSRMAEVYCRLGADG
jgi:hypothetical protein